jgi:hypothetical protein
MLRLRHAAYIPCWPAVTFRSRRASIMFFSAHGVYSSKKPKQTHCGSHKKVWYSSGAMMLFMAVRVSILFMSTLDLWESVEGVKGTTY